MGPTRARAGSFGCVSPPIDRAGNGLCLLTVHAHPDDEASKGSGTVARYSAEGIRTVLVCCTGGAAGDILTPAGDPDRYPEAGDPWQPSKLYYTGFSMRRVRMLHEAYERRGEESPYQRWFERELPPETHFTTFVDVSRYLDKRREALLAHRTQVDPDGHWFRLPDDVVRDVFPWEEYVLARSLVDTGVGPDDAEDDLFAGLRA